MAKLKEDLYAVLPGEIYPQTFKAGDECPKELHDLAKSLGILDEEVVKTKDDLPQLSKKVMKDKLSNKGNE